MSGSGSHVLHPNDDRQTHRVDLSRKSSGAIYWLASHYVKCGAGDPQRVFLFSSYNHTCFTFLIIAGPWADVWDRAHAWRNHPDGWLWLRSSKCFVLAVEIKFSAWSAWLEILAWKDICTPFCCHPWTWSHFQLPESPMCWMAQFIHLPGLLNCSSV